MRRDGFSRTLSIRVFETPKTIKPTLPGVLRIANIPGTGNELFGESLRQSELNIRWIRLLAFTRRARPKSKPP